MTPDRLRQIEELYHSARESSASGRAALLALADPELRREVECLLARPLKPRWNPLECCAATYDSGSYRTPAWAARKSGGTAGIGHTLRARIPRSGLFSWLGVPTSE